MTPIAQRGSIAGSAWEARDREGSEHTAMAEALTSERISPVAAMLRVSRAAANHDSAEVLDEIVRATRTVIAGAGAASIFLVAPTVSGLRLAAVEGLSEHYRRTLRDFPELLEKGATAAAIVTKDVVWVADTQTDPHSARVRDLTRDEGIRSLLAVPLLTSNAVVGALGVYRTRPGSWSEEEIELLRFFAEHAAAAVQTTQLMAQKEEQLLGLERLINTLRAQGHEHANRLHAVHGMLMLGQPDEAVRFLGELLATHHFVRSELGEKIDHPALAGLLLAESAIAAQRNIELRIEEGTRLAKTPQTLSDFQLVTLVGNLLDNALDAVEPLSTDRRVVSLFASDEGSVMRLEVRDFGLGLPDSLEAITTAGVTTKPGHLGQGLALVRATAEAAMGSLEAISHDDGTTIAVRIPFTHPAFPPAAWGDTDG